MRKLCTLVLLLVATLTVHAQDSDTLLVAPCSGCHQPGSSTVLVDIRNLPVAELLTKLRNYQRDEGQPTLMNRLVKGYTDAELQRLANTLGRKE